MVTNYVIYGLIDPNTKELRYIGQTVNLKKRVNMHHNPLKRNNIAVRPQSVYLLGNTFAASTAVGASHVE